MPANETPERLAAAAWIRVDPPGEGPVFTSAGFGLRSQLSCQNRLIITPINGGSDASYSEAPFIVVPFDREFTRKETTVIAQIVQTVEAVERLDYPWALPDPANFDETDVNNPDTRLLFMPIHLDWIGDFAAPSWLPFSLGLGINHNVPAGFDLDIYNAIALIPYSVGDAAIGQDITIHVFKHPPVIEGASFELDQTLVIPIAS